MDLRWRALGLRGGSVVLGGRMSRQVISSSKVPGGLELHSILMFDVYSKAKSSINSRYQGPYYFTICYLI